jgi:hypothetical protein
VALTECTLLALPREQFQAIMGQSEALQAQVRQYTRTPRAGRRTGAVRPTSRSPQGTAGNRTCPAASPTTSCSHGNMSWPWRRPCCGCTPG